MSKSENKLPVTPVDCSFAAKGVWLVKVNFDDWIIMTFDEINNLLQLGA